MGWGRILSKKEKPHTEHQRSSLLPDCGCSTASELLQPRPPHPDALCPQTVDQNKPALLSQVFCQSMRKVAHTDGF